MSERSAFDFLVVDVFGQYELEDGERRLLQALLRDGRVAVPAGRGAGLLLRSLLVGLGLPGVALVVFGDTEAAQGLVTRLGELGVGRLGLLAEGMPDADLDRMMHRARTGAITLLLVNEALVGNPRVTAGLAALGAEPGVSMVCLDPELFRPADRGRWETIVKTVDALTADLPGVRTLDLGASADAAAGFDLSAEERAAIFGAMDFGMDAMEDEEENTSTVIRQSPFAAGRGAAAAPIPPSSAAASLGRPEASSPATPARAAAPHRPTDTDGESRVDTKVQPPLAAAAGFDTLSRILGRAGDVPEGPGSSLFGDRSRITVEPPRIDISDEAVEKMTSKLDSLFSTSTGQTRPDLEPEDLVPVRAAPAVSAPVVPEDALEDLGAVETGEDDVEVLLDDEVLLVEDDDEVVTGGLDELISTLDAPGPPQGPSSQERALRNLADTFPTRGPAVVAPPPEHDTLPGAVSRIVLPGDLGAMGSSRRAGSVTQIVLPGDMPSVPGEEVADDELDDLLGPDLDEAPAQTMDEMLEDLGVLEDEDLQVAPAMAAPAVVRPVPVAEPEVDDEELALVLDEDLEAAAALEIVDEVEVAVDADEVPLVLDVEEAPLSVDLDEGPFAAPGRGASAAISEDEELLLELEALEDAAASAPQQSAPAPSAPPASAGDDDVDLAELLGSLADDVVDDDEVPAGAVSRIILPDEIPLDIPGPGPDTGVILPEELEAGLASLGEEPEADERAGAGHPSPGSVSQIILPDETGSALGGLADLGELDVELAPAHPGTVSGILLPGDGVNSPESLLDSLVPDEDGVYGAPATPAAPFRAASLAVVDDLDGMDEDPLAGLGGLDDVESFDVDEDVSGGETLPDVLGALGNAPSLDEDSPEAIEAALRRLAEEELAEETAEADPLAGFGAAPFRGEPAGGRVDGDSPESIEAALRRLAEDELAEERPASASSGKPALDENPWDFPATHAAEAEPVMGGSTLPGTRLEAGQPDLDDLDSPEAIEAALRRLAEEELRDEGYAPSPPRKPVVDETPWDLPATGAPEGGDVVGGGTLPDTRLESGGSDFDDLDSPEAIEAALRRLAEEELAAEAPRPAPARPVAASRPAAPPVVDAGPLGTFFDEADGSPGDLDSSEAIEAALRRLAEDDLIDEARGAAAPAPAPARGPARVPVAEPEFPAFDGADAGYDGGEAILGGETLPGVHLESGDFEDADSPQAIEAALRRLAEEELQEQGLPARQPAQRSTPAGAVSPRDEEPAFDAAAEPMLDMDAFLSGLDEGEGGGGEDALVEGLVDELMVPSREVPPRATGPDDVDELLGAAVAAVASAPAPSGPASSGAGGGFLDELLAQSGMDGSDLALMDHPDAAPARDAFTSPEWAMEAPRSQGAVSPDDLDLDALLDGPSAVAAPAVPSSGRAMADEPDLGALVSGLGVDEAGPRDSSVGAVSRVILPGEDTAGLDALDGLGGPAPDELSDALDALDGLDVGTVPAAPAAKAPRGPMVDEPDLGALVGGLGFDGPDARDEEAGAVSRIILADEDGLSALDQFLARQEEEASASAASEPEPEPVPEPEDEEGLAALDDLAAGLEFIPGGDESTASAWDSLPEPGQLAEPELELPSIDVETFEPGLQAWTPDAEASPLEAALGGIDDGAVLAAVEPGAESVELSEGDAFELEPGSGQAEWVSDEDGALAEALAEAEAVLRGTDLDSLGDEDFPMASDAGSPDAAAAAQAAQAAQGLVLQSNLDEQSAYLAEQADELAREGRGYERPTSAASMASPVAQPEPRASAARPSGPVSPPVPPPPRRVPASHDLSPAIRRLVLGTEGDLQRVASTYELLAKGGEDEPMAIENELRALEELFPTDERVLFALSLVEMGRRRSAEGVSYAMRAAKRCRSVEDTPNEAFIYGVLHERYPDDLGVVDRLAETLVALGHAADAATKLSATADRLMAAGAVEDAVSLYDRALTVAPDDDELFGRLLGACRSAGRESQALELVNARLAERPRSVDLNLQKAISLTSLGRTDKADKTFRAAFDLVWDNPFRLVELEQTLDEYGCREQQDLVRRRILEIDPSNMVVAEKLAREERLRSLERDAPVIEDLLPMDEPVEITDGDSLLSDDLVGDESAAAVEAEANDIFSRAARVSPKFAALVDDLRNLEEELQVADGAESVADRFLAELVRKFMDVGERVGSDHPTEALELYERSRSYLGLFKDPTALFLWQEQLDRRIDTTRSRVH